MIVIDLSKQKALDVDPRELQQINVAGNLDHAINTKMPFIYEERKQICIELFTSNSKTFVNLLYYNLDLI